jgi:hypothetical protein
LFVFANCAFIANLRELTSCPLYRNGHAIRVLDAGVTACD